MSVDQVARARVTAPGSVARVEVTRERTLALALRGIGLTFLALAMVEAALLYVSAAGPYGVLLLLPACGLVYAGAGLLAWSRRPANRFGAIVVLGGLILLAAGLLNVDERQVALIAVGLVLATVPVAAVLHLLLAFPSGRLGPPERWLVITMYGAATVLQAPSYLFAPLPAPFGVFSVADAPELVTAGAWAQNIVGAVVLGTSAILMVRRLRAADPAQRRTFGLVTVVGSARSCSSRPASTSRRCSASTRSRSSWRR